MARYPTIGKNAQIIINSANLAPTAQATGDIHHLRSWAAGKGIRVEGRGRPSKDLIRQYERDTGRKYVSGKVVNKSVSAQPETARKKVYRPNCPIHKTEMVFDTNDNFFKCPHRGCVIKAMPKNEANKPIIGTGVIKLLQVDTGAARRYYLTADNNVRMDITNVVADIDIDNKAFMSSTVRVSLELFSREG